MLQQEPAAQHSRAKSAWSQQGGESALALRRLPLTKARSVTLQTHFLKFVSSCVRDLQTWRRGFAPGFCASRDQRIRSSCGAVVEKPAAICLAKALWWREFMVEGLGHDWWQKSVIARLVPSRRQSHSSSCAFSPHFVFLTATINPL